jgi:hypothetical protein
MRDYYEFLPDSLWLFYARVPNFRDAVFAVGELHDELITMSRRQEKYAIREKG